MSSKEPILEQIKTSNGPKIALTGLFGLLVLLDGIKLLTSLVTLSASDIGISLIGLAVDGLLLVAVIKQWKFIIKIARIVILILVILSAFEAILGIFGLITAKKSDGKKIYPIVNELVLVLDIILYFIIAWLIGKYNKQLESSSPA